MRMKRLARTFGFSDQQGAARATLRPHPEEPAEAQAKAGVSKDVATDQASLFRASWFETALRASSP